MARKRPETGADPVERYAREVVSGDISAGQWVRKACERHLRDLKEQAKRGIVWRWDLAQEIVDFFPTCLRHGEGQYAGETFELLPWQLFVVGQLYGWRWRADLSRRFRTAYIEATKGCGKTPLVGGLALYELLRGPDGAEIFSAASGRDQAKIVLKRAQLMRDKSPAVKQRIKTTLDNLAAHDTHSFFRSVSREAGSLEGHNVHLAIVDEVHVHKTSDVCDTMQDGTKGRPDALVIEITNTGAGTTNVCFDHHQYTQKILDGMMENDAWFGVIFGIDPDDDWRDETCWDKASPSLDVTITRNYLREQISKAEGMPARTRRVKRLNFGIWDDAGLEPAIDPAVWKACGASVDRESFYGRECYGGLDLSAVNDLTALVLVFPNEDRTIDVLPFFWLPDDELATKERRDQAPYRTWKDLGFLETTPGPTIDDWFVARRIEQLAAEFEILEIGYDRWGMEKFKGTLRSTTDWDDTRIDELFRPFGQGYVSMSAPIKELERLLANKRLRHGLHPVLTMCASAAVQLKDPADNRKWAKDKATHRIDGIVALTMAIGIMAEDLGNDSRRSVYDEAGFFM